MAKKQQKKAVTEKSNASKPAKPHARKTREGMSGLDAAAKVLSESKEPMGCADLTQRVMEKGLWKTGGKTPAATINAAILREIKTKGTASRFRKAGRGMFAVKGG